MADEFDILIENTMVVDGIDKAYKGSIGIKGEWIAAIGDVSGDSKKTVDATGLVATPGFIDPHSHGDWGLPWYPKAESAVLQGCTTVVSGQCGGSFAPLNEVIRPPRNLVDEIFEKHPYIYHEPTLLQLNEVNEMLDAKYGWNIDWRTMDEFFKHLESKGISVNMSPLVGHGTVRFAVMGEDYKRNCTESELEQMKEHIHQAMKEGCVGMSTGLDYDPDVFADRNEIDECISVLKEYDGIYFPHWRRTGRRRDVKAGTRYAEPIEGILEVIDTCRKTCVKLNIAHLAPGWHTVPEMTARIAKSIGEATVDAIDNARAEGLDVTFDTIPCTCWEPFPYICGPHFAQWLRILGSREEMTKWLRVEDFKKRAWDDIAEGKIFQRVVINPCLNPHWAEHFKVVEHRNEEYTGVTLDEAAKKMGKDPWNTLCELIIEDPDAKGAHTDYRGHEEQMKVFYKHPHGALGLDVWICDDRFVQKSPPWSIHLPDVFSGYPKFFINSVLEGNYLTLEEAVAYCTSMPAKNVRIKERGVLKEGYYADIVLMNLKELAIVSPPELSNTYPKGIEYVFVNGVPVVEKGRHNGNTPGKILKR